MSLLGNEKASQRRFKITGKFTGGVGSSGKWTPAGGGRFGNDWEAEAVYHKNVAEVQQTTGIGRRLAASTDVKIPGKNTVIKDKAVALAKEAARKKAKSVLSPRAQSEATRLENLFTK